MTELHEAVNQLYRILDSKLKEYQECKECSVIEDALDQILILYYEEVPDGDRQNEILESMDPINDKEAVILLSNTLKNIEP